MKKKKKKILEKKRKKKKKKHVGKVKAENQLNIKKKSTKIILEKKCEETLYQNKNYVEKHCNNPQCFFKKTYEAKSTKTILKKKKKKVHKKKPCKETL